MIIQPFSKTYEGRCVLNFSGIELEKGKIYAVIGANGSGKSTFAKVLAGIIPADRRGRSCDASVGYMPQKNYAFRMSTRKNILLGASDENRTDALIDAFGLRVLENKRADKLSGGETARMALARLMMKSFDLVILDEPTAPMDMESTVSAEQQIVRYVQETDCALILVTHSLQQAKRIADEVLFFDKGELVERGEKDTMLNAPQNERTETFLNFYG